MIVVITLRRDDRDGESVKHAPLSPPGRGVGGERGMILCLTEIPARRASKGRPRDGKMNYLAKNIDVPMSLGIPSLARWAGIISV